jgi:hypothetical protein
MNIAATSAFLRPSFMTCITNATSLTQNALDNVANLPTGVQNIADPNLGALGNAQNADAWLSMSLGAVDAPKSPSRALEFATQAQGDLRDGISLLQAGPNVRIDATVLRADFAKALDALHITRDIVEPNFPLPQGAAH